MIDISKKPEASWKKWLKWIDDYFEVPFLVIGMLAIIVLITYQTIYRYIVSNITGGTAIVGLEEASRFIFIWISYLAIPLAIKQRNNIRVDILYDRLSDRWQKMSWIVVDGCILILTAVIFFMGIDHLQMMLKYPQISPALNIPFFIPYLILPIGFGLMSIRCLQDLVKQILESGLKDTLIGVLIVAVIFSPLFLDFDIPAMAWLFGYFVLFVFIGVPIAMSLGLSALATILCAHTMPIEYISQICFTSIDSFPIMAIPFFVAAGVFMGEGGLSKRLLGLADELLGSFTGGLALATVATCMFFAAISGSGPATVAAIGSLTIPAMVERGYSRGFSAALVAVAGSIGVMIPPSNPFVVYGVSAQVSIGKLFMGGIVPGLIVGFALMGVSYYYAKKNNWKGEARKRTFRSVGKAFWEAKWALMVPIIILGGIYSGYMTPTESAAVAAFYGLIVGVFIHKGITRKNFVYCFTESCSTSAIIIVLMAMATIFGNILTIEQIPTRIATWMLAITDSKYLILLIVTILLLFVGTFMEALAAIVILTPILLPIATKVGIDPIHFGIIMVVNLAIGFITPPVGVNLFVSSGIAKLKIEEIAKAVVPFLLAMIAVLLLITYVPSISMFLTQFVR
ncbi:TRAP transporter large permease subunit [Desulfitobacterium sp. PCE1]|uniref:TRAP transporter large permease n=1 Tax=Desulfitobacterium sp. PCE1 TaxID=146907 RepID=UPI0003788CEA|nr:TRAP transporter large permease subunit [Desulfitobacterium sp. PCE1]